MNEHRSKDSLLTNAPTGLSVLTACLFIVGEIAGTGILALPEAVKSCGWSGVFAIVIICLASAFTGVVLGKCWLILENRDESLKTIKTRNAYSLIGQRSLGYTGKFLASSSQSIQLFGGSVVSLLLLAENIQRLTDAIGFHLTFCEWIVITGLILLPFTFAGSPVDFWPIAISAMSSTAIASVLILVEIFRQNKIEHSIGHPPTGNFDEIVGNLTNIHLSIDESNGSNEFIITAKSYLLGLSTMTYGFAGASAMPTIQNDMKNKSKFTTAVILAFILLLLIYLPVSIVGYAVYGDTLRSNVMRNLNNSPIVTITDVLIAIHVFSAYLILLNPVNLNVEHALNITHAFNFSRCFSRTTVSVVAIFVGLCIPKFGQLLNLVGASAVCLQSFILPCIFYYKLITNPSLGRPFTPISSLSSPPSTEFNESSYTISSHIESTSTYICTSYSSITSSQVVDVSDGKLNIQFKILLLILTLIAITLAIIGSFYSLLDLFDPQAFTIPCFICNTDHLT